MNATACFSFDNLGEAADIGAGRLAGPRPQGEEPSIAVGLPKLLALLDRCALRGTFFVEGWNAKQHPRAVAEIVARGHELGMHGWLHETWHALDAATEADLAARATDALEAAAGVRPLAFRAPGGRRSAERGGLFVLICHAFIAGADDARVAALESVIDAAQRDPRIAVRTIGEVADAIR